MEPEKIPSASREEKKIEKVTVGEVKRRKKPLGKRFTETFVQGEAHGAWNFVLYDVLVPAAKDMVADAFSQGIERMLFGEARSRSRRPYSSGSALGGRSNYVNYTRYSASEPRREEPRTVSRKARANHNFDEIVLTTRPEAEEVLDRLNELINRYGSASVADLYELVGVTGSYTDDKWGWFSLSGSDITRVRDGYLLDVPKPDPLD